MLNAIEIIKRQFNGRKNPITPNVIEVGFIKPNIAFELSGGDWMNEPLFGVSVVKFVPEKNETELVDYLGKTFDTLEDANYYIEALKEEVKLKEKED